MKNSYKLGCKVPKVMKLLFLIGKYSLMTFIFSGIFIINGCRKEDAENEINEDEIITTQQFSEIESSIKDIYELKKEFALQFENRDNVFVNDIFYSAEIKDAVIFQLLSLAEMGMIKEYSHSVQILKNEFFKRSNGEVVIPGLETVTSVTIPPNSDNKIVSDYTDKIFFSFVEKDGRWKLKGIEMLSPNYEIDTKYSKEVVFNYAETSRELMEKVIKDNGYKISYEKRRMFEQFFEKGINEKVLGMKLLELYKNNNLLPSEVKLKSQGILNKKAAVAYALKYSDASGSMNTTSSYNKAYKSYAPTDCADFASQCLFAGGWRNESPYTNLNLWWYNNRGTTKTSDDTASNIWVGANALYKYVVPSKASLKSVSQALAGSVDIADLIWIPKTGTKNHVMIVTNVGGMCLSNGTYITYIYYSAHTSNRRNCNLGSYTDIVFGHFQ